MFDDRPDAQHRFRMLSPEEQHRVTVAVNAAQKRMDELEAEARKLVARKRAINEEFDKNRHITSGDFLWDADTRRAQRQMEDKQREDDYYFSDEAQAQRGAEYQRMKEAEGQHAGLANQRQQDAAAFDFFFPNRR